MGLPLLGDDGAAKGDGDAAATGVSHAVEVVGFAGGDPVLPAIATLGAHDDHAAGFKLNSVLPFSGGEVHDDGAAEGGFTIGNDGGATTAADGLTDDPLFASADTAPVSVRQPGAVPPHRTHLAFSIGVRKGKLEQGTDNRAPFERNHGIKGTSVLPSFFC